MFAIVSQGGMAGGNGMSNLVAVIFPGEDTAGQVLHKLKSMQKEYLVDLRDACVVVREQHGNVRLRQRVNLASMGAIGGGTLGSLWGTLISLLCFHPLVGLLDGTAPGAGARALPGTMRDYGIDDEFMRSLGTTLRSASSALFVLVQDNNTDKVLPELAAFHGTVLRTSLSNEQEARLKKALQHAQLSPGSRRAE